MDELAGVEAGLLGGVAEVGDGQLVFRVVFVFERGEVDGLGEVGVDVLPLGDEFFVDGVELVGFGGDEGVRHRFEPVPLDDGGFEERGGGVGVVLEEFGGFAGLCACPAYVEAAVEGGWLVVPGPLDGGDGGFGDVEFGVTLFVDDVLGGGEAHLLQLVACGFEGVDLGGGELVGGGLVPVGRAVFEGVEGEALGFDGLLPVFAWGEGDALHYSPALPLPRAAVAAALGEAAAEASAGGYAGAGGVAATGVRGVTASANYAAEAVASPSAVVVAVGDDDGDESAVAVGALLRDRVGWRRGCRRLRGFVRRRSAASRVCGSR